MQRSSPSFITFVSMKADKRVLLGMSGGTDSSVAEMCIRDRTDIIEKSGKILNPRTIDKDGNIVYVPIDDWCYGFFPGNIWHMSVSYTHLDVYKRQGCSLKLNRPKIMPRIAPVTQSIVDFGINNQNL